MENPITSISCLNFLQQQRHLLVVCSLKTQLSKEIRANFWDEIKDKLWNNIFWSDSYFITTTGGADIETIEKYIQDRVLKTKTKIYQKANKKRVRKRLALDID